MKQKDTSEEAILEFLSALKDSSINTIINNDYARLSLHDFAMLFPNTEYPKIGETFNSGTVVHIGDYIFISKTGDFELDLAVEYPPPDYCVSITFYSEIINKQHAIDKIFAEDTPSVKNNVDWWEDD